MQNYIVFASRIDIQFLVRKGLVTRVGWFKLFVIYFFCTNTDLCHLPKVKENDKIIDKSKNPDWASAEMANFFLSFIALLVFLFTYNLELESFDSATRAFINSAFADFFHCISSPGLIIYGFIGTRRKCYQIIKKMEMQAKQICCGIGCWKRILGKTKKLLVESSNFLVWNNIPGKEKYLVFVVIFFFKSVK